MRYTWLGFAMIFLSQAASLALCAPTPAKELTSAPVAKHYSDQEIKDLIRNLGGTSWLLRESSTSSLMDASPESFDMLKQAFAQTSSYEVRRRIRMIVQEIYFTQRLGSARAFLGISYMQGPQSALNDTRIPGDTNALSITLVFNPSAGYFAGIRPGDLFVSLNGQYGTPLKTAMEFTKWISEQSPGSSCRIGLVRGGMGILLGPDNLASGDLGVLKVKEITHVDDGRVPAGQGGLQIVELGKVDPKYGLGVGDVLVALDGELLPPQAAGEIFSSWTRRPIEPIKPPTPQNVFPGVPPDRSKLAKPRSAQFLRGGKYLEKEVTLGRRPRYLPSAGSTPARTAPPDKIDAVSAEFSAWWQKSFDPTNSFSERAEEDPQWRLDPNRPVR